MKRHFFLLVLAAALAGCDGPAAKDPRMKLAEKCRVEGDFPAAERQIRRYLDAHSDSAEAHLTLASLYDESLNDPVGAAYHYREYLRFAPGSPQRAEVEAWMRAAQAKCAPAQPSAPAAVSAAEYARLSRENASLRELAQRQQKELAELRRKAPAAPAPVPAPAPEAASAAPDYAEYAVQPGDSLGKIARRFYGSSQRIEPILKANDLTARSILQVGQKLKIPKKTR